MSIEKLNRDLAVIQKLSDLPNSDDGLSSEQLKAKFDESGLEIQKWINEVLLPGLQAENISFAGNSELDAQTVQAAMELVHSQIRNISAGSIANGTVSKEKLAAALLERVFGGRVWVSLDCPTEADTPEREFPVGQIWLRPAFRVENLAGNSWTGTGCTAVQEGSALRITGNQTVAAVSAVQRLTGIGQASDRVLVVLDVAEKDREITNLTVRFNGGETATLQGGVYEAALQTGGMLTVQIDAQWPATSLASGSVVLKNVTVVNPDAVLRQLAGAKDLRDWNSWLREKTPFAEAKSGREMYVQAAPGVWQRFDQEVLPVGRGGTGLAEIGEGELLYGKDGGYAKLEKPEGAAFLQFTDGNPVWAAMSVMAEHGYARIATGSYVGNGEERTIELPVEPKLLVIHSAKNTSYESGEMFQSGIKHECTSSGTDASGAQVDYYTGITLEGSTLRTYYHVRGDRPAVNPRAHFYNSTGSTYPWVAIY